MTDASPMFLAVAFTAWCGLLALAALTERWWNR